MEKMSFPCYVTSVSNPSQLGSNLRFTAGYEQSSAEVRPLAHGVARILSGNSTEGAFAIRCRNTSFCTNQSNIWKLHVLHFCQKKKSPNKPPAMGQTSADECSLQYLLRDEQGHSWLGILSNPFTNLRIEPRTT